MQLHLTPPDVRQDGMDFDVYVNGANIPKGGRGFAVIQLDEHGHTDLQFDEPEELDRLIKAAAEAKRMLTAARTPHAHTGGTGRCGECGCYPKHHIAPPAGPHTVTVDECIERLRNGGES